MFVPIVFIICILIALVLFYAGFIVWQSGYFRRERIHVKEIKPFTFAFTRHQESYSVIPSSIKTLANKLNSVGLPESKLKYCLGVYFDAFQSSTTRYWLGFVVPNDPTVLGRIRLLEDVFVNTLPRMSVMSCKYPSGNFLSPMLLPSRVYPRIAKYAKRHDVTFTGPAVEFYTEDDNKKLNLEYCGLFSIPKELEDFYGHDIGLPPPITSLEKPPAYQGIIPGTALDMTTTTE